MPETMSVWSISLGERHRADLGDVDGLAKSIEELGLLHPIVVKSDGTLIAGERRLAACKSLGWQQVPVTVIDLEEIIRGEIAENQMRKDFTPSEAVAIGKALEERERARAQERQQATHFGGAGNLPTPQGNTRDLVGAALGMSGRNYEKAKAVVKAAEEDSSLAPLVEQMDEQSVDSAYKQLREVKPVPYPAVRNRTASAVAERYDTIRQMAADRHRSYDIAARVGMSDERVRQLLHQWGIETVEDRIGKNGRKLDANKIMDATVQNAGPTDQTVSVLFASWGELDEAKFPEWEGSLTEAIRLLTKIRNRLRKENE